MLEAVASHDLWIWHAFFGMAGANNDLNVLDNSNLFDTILAGESPRAPYTVNGRRYEQGYYLADGIYPRWATFVKSFSATTDEKHSYFKRKQESARKDIERAFGVLQGRWGILQHPARAWEIVKIQRVMYTCIILHNMILKDQNFILREYKKMWVDPAPNLSQDRWIDRCETQRRKTREMRDAGVHGQLQRDLMEHVWQKRLQYQQEHEEEYSEDDE